MTSSVAEPRLREYFREAMLLRLALQQNLDDYAFANQGGRIVYLMDANVVRIFLDPVRESVHFALFQEGKESEDLSSSTALVSAEFLFSRRLAGQGDTPALIARSHADDLTSVLAGISRDAEADLPHSGQARRMAGSTRRALRRLIERAHRGEIDRVNAIRELQERIPECVHAVLAESLQALLQFRRLYNEDLLRPLELHPEATVDVLVPNLELVADLKRHLTATLLASRSDDGRTRSLDRGTDTARREINSRTRIERDSTALAQVILLDRSARDDGRKVHYVLVTADKSLFDAYVRWFWTGSHLDRQEPFLLRLPLQYIPILNINEMPNRIDDSEIIHKTCDTLDLLFANLKKIDPYYPHTLAVHRVFSEVATEGLFRKTLTALYGFDPYTLAGEGELDILMDNRQKWQVAFRDGVLLNTELMRRRLRIELEPVSDLLDEDGDLLLAIHDHQRRVLADVAAAHLAVNTRFSLTGIIRGLGHAAAGRPPRGLLAVRMRLHRLANGAPLHAFMERIISDADSAEIDRIDAQLRSALDQEALLFAACVAFRCALWPAAREYAWRACMPVQVNEENAEQEDAYYEAAYVCALATRFALPSSSSVSDAIALSRKAAEHYRTTGDSLGLARALSEWSALLLFLLYLLRLRGQEHCPISSEEVDAECRDLSQRLSEAVSVIDNEAGDPELEPIVDVVRTQAYGNIISTELYASVLGAGRGSSTVIERVDQELVLKAMENISAQEAGVDFPVVLEVELLALRLHQLRNDPTGSHEAALALFEATQRAQGIKHTLTPLDRAEFRFFKIFADRYVLDDSSGAGRFKTA
jgi:hypothetical protein